MKLRSIIVAVSMFAVVAVAPAADLKSQTLALYQAIHKRDWKALYFLTAFSAKVKKSLEGPDKFAADVQRGIDQGGNGKMVEQVFSSMKNIRVGKTTITGNHATVVTYSDITVQGSTKHFQGVAHMLLDGKVWKWDLAYSEDLSNATAMRLKDLIGTPTGK